MTRGVLDARGGAVMSGGGKDGANLMSRTVPVLDRNLMFRSVPVFGDGW